MPYCFALLRAGSNNMYTSSNYQENWQVMKACIVSSDVFIFHVCRDISLAVLLMQDFQPVYLRNLLGKAKPEEASFLGLK